MAQGTETHLTVLLPVVDRFQHRVSKNERGIGKVDPVVLQVLAPFLFAPFKAHA
jgi:hypothetical protein